MEIKTSEEIYLESDNCPNDGKDGKYYCDKKWVAVDDLISDLENTKTNVELAMGNQQDTGYLKAIEALLNYIKELNRTRE